MSSMKPKPGSSGSTNSSPARSALGEHAEARVLLSGIDVIQAEFIREHLSGNLVAAQEIYEEVASLYDSMRVSLGIVPSGKPVSGVSLDGKSIDDGSAGDGDCSIGDG